MEHGSDDPGFNKFRHWIIYGSGNGFEWLYGYDIYDNHTTTVAINGYGHAGECVVLWEHYGEYRCKCRRRHVPVHVCME
jgi:hypothetical protein